MNLRSKLCATAVALLLSSGFAPAALADETASGGGRLPVVLIPYEEPGSGDPYAAAVTRDFVAEFAQSAVPVKLVVPAEHVDAIARAGSLCHDNAAAGLLVPEGRYEQTMKIVHVPFAGSITSFPTHVELRLDQVDCAGKVTWSKVAICDESRSGVMFSPTNVDSLIDECFHKAAHEVAALSGAPSPSPSRSAGAMTAKSAGPLPPGPYLLVPFEQPGIADPRAADMTHSLAKAISDRKLDVKIADPIDRLTAVADSASLCKQFQTTAIVVPEVRAEQTKRTHGELRLTALTCDGQVAAHGFNTAEAAPSVFGHNGGAAIVQVTERASGGALDQLFNGAAQTSSTTR